MSSNDTIHARLESLGLTLPVASAPVANYVPAVAWNGLLVISGQLPFKDGAVMYPGLLGRDVSVEQGTEAARQCGLNIIAQVAAALEGDLGRVEKIIRLGGFVACTPDFTAHPQVINGTSDLMVAVFDDIGRHARAATGAASLPLNAPVEVDALVAIRD
ncbi:MAG: RidA family protein [Rhodospirillaceae bacterium]